MHRWEETMIVKERGNREPRVLRVLAALLGESPEDALLRRAVRPSMALRKVENRFQVATALREFAPDVVVFAVQDRHRLATAPLIGECARARPATKILLLCAAAPPRSGAVLAAARAGARVLVAPAPDELVSILERITRSLESDLALDCESLGGVQPPMLRQLLCAAAETVAADGRVDTLAHRLRVSTRTLSRYTRRSSLVSPKALLSAVRLLWACALMESASRDARSVARASGFSGPAFMRAAANRYFAVCPGDDSGSALPGYQDALRQIVGALGGQLAI